MRFWEFVVESMSGGRAASLAIKYLEFTEQNESVAIRVGLFGVENQIVDTEIRLRRMIQSFVSLVRTWSGDAEVLGLKKCERVTLEWTSAEGSDYAKIG